MKQVQNLYRTIFADRIEKSELNKIAARWPAKAVAQFFYF